jgi:hypothetical protein
VGPLGALIQRAADAEAGFVQDVSVNHGRGGVFVSEEFLNGADVLAVFKQMSGETVPPRKSFAHAVGLIGSLLR